MLPLVRSLAEICLYKNFLRFTNWNQEQSQMQSLEAGVATMSNHAPSNACSVIPRRRRRKNKRRMIMVMIVMMIFMSHIVSLGFLPY